MGGWGVVTMGLVVGGGMWDGWSMGVTGMVGVNRVWSRSMVGGVR